MPGIKIGSRDCSPIEAGEDLKFRSQEKEISLTLSQVASSRRLQDVQSILKPSGLGISYLGSLKGLSSGQRSAVAVNYTACLTRLRASGPLVINERSNLPPPEARANTLSREIEFQSES
ncbi:hypothetical protein HZH68_000914 [Vespula germanica]|uniref:Uncharacterized protein n=1 Tax=Vespula germanica TaxID=30212 RepID=A0A834U6B0_VESGE|nr:hypothetical protein HZH68_000914 [Vespula germanica]